MILIIYIALSMFYRSGVRQGLEHANTPISRFLTACTQIILCIYRTSSSKEEGLCRSLES